MVTQADYSILYLSATNFSGTSSVAIAWSGTFDDLIGGHISKFFKDNASISVPGLAPYPDIFAVALILILSGKMLTLDLMGVTSIHPSII